MDQVTCMWVCVCACVGPVYNIWILCIFMLTASYFSLCEKNADERGSSDADEIVEGSIM